MPPRKPTLNLTRKPKPSLTLRKIPQPTPPPITPGRVRARNVA